MAFMNKEEFQNKVLEHYNSLTKEDFAKLMSGTHYKIKELVDSDDIKFERNTDTDDIELVYASQPLYEKAVNTYFFCGKTRKISFNQYKCLAAFIKFNQTSENNYKQF